MLTGTSDLDYPAWGQEPEGLWAGCGAGQDPAGSISWMLTLSDRQAWPVLGLPAVALGVKSSQAGDVQGRAVGVGALVLQEPAGHRVSSGRVCSRGAVSVVSLHFPHRSEALTS